MNNLYNNITNKNNFCGKLIASSVLLVSFIYFLSTVLFPATNSAINTINNAYISAAKQYNTLPNNTLVTKTNNTIFNTINTATYINNGQMLARQIDNNNLQSYINNAKGSVLKLNSANKSQDQTYSYDSYGKLITNTIKLNSTLNVANSFQYNGERFDSNTNLQYLRARFYNSETKRFVNQDSYELLNRFGYVNGNPVMGIDPSGHMYKSAIFIFSVKRFFSRYFNVRISGETVISAYNRGERDFNRMNLSEAKLNGAKLSGAKLNRANLSSADLSGADLFGAELNGAKLAWTGDNIGAILTDANLSKAELNRAELNGANLTEANLFEAKLIEAELSTTKLTKAFLVEANLTGAYLNSADLTEANLSEANLSGANLSGADLSDADLGRANLTEANLDRAILTKANLSWADLDRAILTNITEFFEANFSGAIVTKVDFTGTNCSAFDYNRTKNLYESVLIPT